jgi:DNA-directed RNA polymerase specialized sigma24 family protein
MTTRGFKTRSNPSGRRVPSGYPEPVEFQRQGDVPGIRYSIDTPSQEVPSQEINAFYRSGTPEANAAVERELMKPARDAVNWLKRKGWIDDPARADDYVQAVVVGMLNRTGSVQNWRANVGFRRATASMLARRFASQGWPAATKERTGRLGGGEDQPDTVDSATGTGPRGGGEDAFTKVQGSAARARQAIQKAIAGILDLDTSNMGADDEEKFVDAIDQLSDPSQAARALNTLDKLSARHASALPQVRTAVDRIQRHLDPLLGKVRSVS